MVMNMINYVTVKNGPVQHWISMQYNRFVPEKFYMSWWSCIPLITPIVTIVFLFVTVQESLETCYQAVVSERLPGNWYLDYVPNSELRCFEVLRQTVQKLMVVLRLLLVNVTLTWQVYVGEHLVPLQSPVLQDLPPTMINSYCIILLY